MPAHPPNSQLPVTPTSQVEFTVPQAPGVTPHSVLEHFKNEPTDEAREWVAQVMNSETFLCEIGDFLKDYGPVQVDKEDIAKCKKYLVNKKLLKQSRGKYVFSKYTAPPSERVGKEDKVFEDVAPIIAAIFEYADNVSKRGNSFSVKPVPAKHLTAGIAGTNHRMDACIIEDKNYKGVLANNNIIIGEEFKKDRTWDDQIDVREQIVGDSHHILNDDPRRMFIYGTTMEDRRMSVWYFSRSHSVKSISFDWVSEDIDRFIEVYLAFAFATPAQLGIDPLVHKAPVHPKSMDHTEQTQQYTYECPPQDPADGQTRYYRTMYSLSPERPYRISGRMTRIWQVIEVDSVLTAEKIAGAKPVILKDVWLDITRNTEAENMDLIFEAVDKFVADARERYPGSQGLKEFMDKEPQFEHFDQQTKTRLEQLLTDKRYRSLFLTKRHTWKGEFTKERSKKVKRPLHPIFVPRTTAKQNAGRVGEVPRTTFSQDSTNLQPKSSAQENLAEKLVPTALADRAFAQKQQSRFVYEEVCSRLWDLPTMGDLVNVLRQALDALQVLWCAGWVHRDISNGNILALPLGNEFKVKLADLEFAQTLGHSTHSSDPRTGTPYFMPVEILRRKYLLQSIRLMKPPKENFADQLNLPGGKSNPHYQRFMNFRRFHGSTFNALPPSATVHIPSPDDVVSYNYQHDLESLWWVTLYYITAGVGHIPSFRYAAKIFTNELEMKDERTQAFMDDIEAPLHKVLHPSLVPVFPDPLNTLREQLHMHHVARALFGQLNLPRSYSEIHAVFAKTFDGLLSLNDGHWKETKIVSLKAMDNPRKRALEDMPALEDNPESVKRGRVRK